MDAETAARLIGRDDILDWKVRPERFALVAVCLGDGSHEKLSVAHIPELDDKLNMALARSGYRDGAALINATDAELMAVKGINRAAVTQIRKALAHGSST